MLLRRIAACESSFARQLSSATTSGSHSSKQAPPVPWLNRAVIADTPHAATTAVAANHSNGSIRSTPDLQRHHLAFFQQPLGIPGAADGIPFPLQNNSIDSGFREPCADRDGGALECPGTSDSQERATPYGISPTSVLEFMNRNAREPQKVRLGCSDAFILTHGTTCFAQRTCYPAHSVVHQSLPSYPFLTG